MNSALGQRESSRHRGDITNGLYETLYHVPLNHVIIHVLQASVQYI